jgi:hypothetical protein
MVRGIDPVDLQATEMRERRIQKLALYVWFSAASRLGRLPLPDHRGTRPIWTVGRNQPADSLPAFVKGGRTFGRVKLLHTNQVMQPQAFSPVEVFDTA